MSCVIWNHKNNVLYSVKLKFVSLSYTSKWIFHLCVMSFICHLENISFSCSVLSNIDLSQYIIPKLHPHTITTKLMRKVPASCRITVVGTVFGILSLGSSNCISSKQCQLFSLKLRVSLFLLRKYLLSTQAWITREFLSIIL